MNKFNLSHIDEDDLNTVKDYLDNDSLSEYFLQSFAEVSFSEFFYEDTNNKYFLELPELSIIHHQIFLENKDLTLKIIKEKNNESIFKVLINSINEEFTVRFKNKIENNLNKDTYKIDKKNKI